MPGPWFLSRQKKRDGRTERRRSSSASRGSPGTLSPVVEPLETRTLLAASGFDALNQGIFGYDDQGEWVSFRYDGQTFVQESATDLNSAGRSADPVAADLDGDGRDEYYIRNIETGDWYSLQPENTQTPLKWVSRWTMSSPILDVLVGDLNGDGREEIITLKSDGNWNTLAWNGNSYVTGQLQGWYRSDNWTGLSLIDLDGNGIDDVIGFDPASAQWLVISQNNGVLSSSRVATWNPSETYTSFLVGDLNGDGLQEMIARNSVGNWWQLKLTDSGYQTSYIATWGTNGGWRDFTIADLNDDGQDEIIGQEMATGAWWQISQQGTSYASRWLGASTPGLSFQYMLTGDVTGDGRTDVVSRDSLGNFWALNSNGSTTQLTLIKNWTTSVVWRDVMLVDYNGDGTSEIIGRNIDNGYWWGINGTTGGYANELIARWGTSADYLYVFANPAASSSGINLITWDSYGDWWSSTLGITSTNTRLANQEPPFRFTQTYSVDVSGDGSPDLVGFDSIRGNWWAVIHDATGTYNRFLGRWDARVAWQDLVFADLDGDGRTDIAACDTISGSWWGILSPGGKFSARKLSTWNPASSYRNVMTLDLNGDGRREIVGKNESGSWWAVTTTDGTTFQNQFLQGWTESWNWQNIATVDLEGDGRTEIIGQASTRGEWWEIYWTGSSYSSRFLAGWNATDSYGDLQIGDITGDGRNDIAVRSSSGNWWMLSYAGINSWSTKFLTGWAVGSGWQNFAMADLLGNGKYEIVAQQISTGNWWGIFSTGTGYENRLLISGSQNRRSNSLQLVDFDHDGKAELVGKDPTSGSWWSFSYSPTGSTVRDLGTLNLQQAVVGAIPGVSDSAFKQFLMKAIPTLALNLASNPLQAARLLMNWASRNADGAISSILQTQTSETINALSRPSDMYHDFFLPNRGGVYCGGFSIFLNNILHLFGFDSFTLNFGELREDLTHVVVIVPIANGSNDWNYYVFDPTFNTLFLEPGTDRMLTFQEMVQKIKNGQTNLISVRQDSFTDRDWLSVGPVSNTQYQLKSAPASTNSNIYVYSRPNYTLTSWLTEIKTPLARYGYSTGTTGYLQLLTNQIFSVGSTNNSAVRDRFISFVVSAGINI